MPEKLEGEPLQYQPEQSEMRKKLYESAIKILEEALEDITKNMEFGYKFRAILSDLAKAGDTRFISSLVKMFFDGGLREFKKDIQKAEAEGKLNYTSFGHTPIDVAHIYHRYGRQIPETEVELHKRGQEFLQVMRIYYKYDFFNPDVDRFDTSTHNFKEAIEYYESVGATKLANELRKTQRSMKKGAQEEKGKLHLEVLKKQAERIFNLFPEQMIAMEDTEETIRQILNDVKNSLKNLE